jgi:O-acetylserine/cysteine efflux transporter
MNRGEILDALCALLPAQFDIVVFRLEIPPAIHSSPPAAQPRRAIEVIRYLENAGRLATIIPLLRPSEPLQSATAGDPPPFAAPAASSAPLAPLPASAVGVAVLIAAIWGFNFVVIKVGVAGMPPLFLAALRFFFSALPAAFFVRRPSAPLKRVAAYGLLLGVGEFGLLFTAIKLGAPAGLSSIFLQLQAFFTAFLAWMFLGEKLRAHNLAGMGIAGAGLAMFAFSTGATSRGLSLPLLVMIPLAALAWAAANITTKTMPAANPLGLMVWSSLFSPLPLGILSLVLEGPHAIGTALSSLGLVTIGALAYLVILSTLVGYGFWNSLIGRHGASRIAPFSLMVPIFGTVSASLVLGERFAAFDAAGAGVIMVGLLVHVFGGRIRARMGR